MFVGSGQWDPVPTVRLTASGVQVSVSPFIPAHISDIDIAGIMCLGLSVVLVSNLILLANYKAIAESNNPRLPIHDQVGAQHI